MWRKFLFIYTPNKFMYFFYIRIINVEVKSGFFNNNLWFIVCFDNVLNYPMGFFAFGLADS